MRLLGKIFVLVLLLLFSFNAALYPQSKERSASELKEAADRVHNNYLTIDTHNDTALTINNPNESYGVTKGQVSFSLMREGGLDAALFAIFIEQKGRDKRSHDSVLNYAIDNINRFKAHVEQNHGVSLAYNSGDLLRNKRNKTLSVMLAIENGYAIGDNLNNIERFKDMGVRLITLCHNKHNNICDASMDTAPPEHNGLSQFGREVVKEMNRLGIIIDVSHASTKTLYDVLEISTMPIVASHSGVYALKNHKRNLKDDEIKAIAAKGGLIQVATGRFFLSNLPKDSVNVATLADHIDYVKNLVGIDHVGLGTDFDGGGGVVGMENVSKVKNLTIELLKRGYTEEELKKFWGGNIIRFLELENL